MSVDSAGLNDDSELLLPRVVTALAAAEIPPSKLGAARPAGLSEPERGLTFDQRIAVTSRDPLSGHEIGARVAPNGDAEWWPESSVVVAGAMGGAGDSYQCCCPALNFFASSSNAERWLDEHPHVRGQVITTQEAILAGRAVFGEVLKED